MKLGVSNSDSKTDTREWLRMIESLRHALEWTTDEQTIEMVQSHISVVLLGEHHARLRDGN